MTLISSRSAGQPIVAMTFFCVVIFATALLIPLLSKQASVVSIDVLELMRVDLSRSNTVVGSVQIHNPSHTTLTIESIDAEIGCRAALLSEQFPFELDPGYSRTVAFTLEADANFLLPVSEKRTELPVELQPIIASTSSRTVFTVPIQTKLILLRSLSSNIQSIRIDAGDILRFLGNHDVKVVIYKSPGDRFVSVSASDPAIPVRFEIDSAQSDSEKCVFIGRCDENCQRKHTGTMKWDFLSPDGATAQLEIPIEYSPRQNFIVVPSRVIYQPTGTSLPIELICSPQFGSFSRIHCDSPGVSMEQLPSSDGRTFITVKSNAEGPATQLSESVVIRAVSPTEAEFEITLPTEHPYFQSVTDQ